MVEYADRQDLFEPLLAWAETKNPTKYKKWQPYIAEELTTIAEEVTVNIAKSNGKKSEQKEENMDTNKPFALPLGWSGGLTGFILGVLGSLWATWILGGIQTWWGIGAIMLLTLLGIGVDLWIRIAGPPPKIVIPVIAVLIAGLIGTAVLIASSNGVGEPLPPELVPYRLLVKEFSKNETIPNANVTVLLSGSGASYFGTTKADGLVTIDIPSVHIGQTADVTIEAIGYETKSIEFNLLDGAKPQEVTLKSETP